MKCNTCGYDETREHDGKMPIMVSFRDHDEKNYADENIEMLCLNCYFMDWTRKRQNKHKRLERYETPKQEIPTDGILENAETGDDLMDELGASLIDLFNRS